MGKLKLLFIDDDEIERIKFKRACDKHQYKHEVTEASNGECALELLKNKEALPELILLDLNMPKMNGIEFLRNLKSDETLKYIPIIVMSSSNNQEDIKECYKIGIAGYIIKPLHYEDYLKKIATLLDYWGNTTLILD